MLCYVMLCYVMLCYGMYVWMDGCMHVCIIYTYIYIYILYIMTIYIDLRLVHLWGLASELGRGAVSPLGVLFTEG